MDVFINSPNISSSTTLVEYGFCIYTPTVEMRMYADGDIGIYYKPLNLLGSESIEDTIRQADQRLDAVERILSTIMHHTND